MTKSSMPTDLEDYIFSIAGAQYIAPRSGLQNDLAFPIAKSLALVTAIRIPPESVNEIITAKWLKDTVEIYRQDDVFHTSFLGNIIFCGADRETVSLTDEATAYLGEIGNQSTFCTASPELLPGPYAYVNQQLREAWKLMDDFNGTCMVTLKPRSSQTGCFESFPLRGSDDRFSRFALRSRIPMQGVGNSPLAGLRVIVKDNINLKGMRTSVGNRSFYATYPACDKTAESIQKLIEMGAVISGKAKMNSFGNWEEPTEFTDYQAPWNPRADGYQSTGGSSAGSAAAVASYDWLDAAIGTDTWGSVTRPAFWCGCFGFRPSTGTLSSDGIEPYVKSWDTPGILCRDLRVCREIAASWLNLQQHDRAPVQFSSVIWPTDFWKIIDQKQSALGNWFAQLIADHVGVELEQLSFEEMWTENPPSEAGHSSLPEFINPARKQATAALAYDVYHNCDDFRARHREMFDCAPYTSIPNQKLWQTERDIGFGKIDIYRKWFMDHILTGKHANALVILPLESMAPRYRDEMPTFKRPPQDGINSLALAPVLHSPVLNVPIGEMPYDSRVTGRQEYLPFSVAVMGVQGTDLILMDTVHSVLESAGFPTKVNTGKRIWAK
ncbi:hypothetical protein FGRMN_7142 [Fusarium graminum]|nr:hypothetical protein FGRMN_7142 [Fusarium graminum]